MPPTAPPYPPPAAAAAAEGGGAAAIVQIEQRTVQRIVAGQAVIDLASAVKELVDNALDAGAKGINIRLFNQGLDIVEVSDDGCGVPPPSRPLMAAKHATSKIQTFDDLYADSSSSSSSSVVASLGFRGEALFCLANVSENLAVATRTASDAVGQRFEFDRDGRVKSGSVVDLPRKVGTTVAVVGLFQALPVRRADLKKRIRTQRSRMMRLLQGYAIMCTGVRFNLIDITGPVGSPSSKSEVKLATSERSATLEETVSSVLGSKFLGGLCRFQVDLSPVVRHARREQNRGVVGRGIGEEESTEEDADHRWQIEGLVSKPPLAAAGVGGAVARDLQFFSINGRPVDLPKISRVLGDVWRSFDTTVGGGGGSGKASKSGGGGGKKRPACVLAVTLPNSLYDVNLAPDKRDVLLTEEAAVCELLREALTALWSGQSGGTFALNEVEQMSNRKNCMNVGQAASDAAAPAPVQAAEVDVAGSSGRDAQCETSGDAQGAPASRAEDSPPERRMQRRNAFVYNPGNIGTRGPDRSYPAEGGAFVTPNPPALREANAVVRNFQQAAMGGDRTASVSSDSGAAGTCPPEASKVSPLDDAQNRVDNRRETNDGDVVVLGSSKRKEKENIQDRRQWEQMQLRFNSTKSNQQEEIQKLAVMNKNRVDVDANQSCRTQEGGDDVSGRDVESKKDSSLADEEDPPYDREKEAPWTAQRASKRAKRSSSRKVVSLEQFAFGSKAADDKNDSVGEPSEDQSLGESSGEEEVREETKSESTAEGSVKAKGRMVVGKAATRGSHSSKRGLEHGSSGENGILDAPSAAPSSSMNSRVEVASRSEKRQKMEESNLPSRSERDCVPRPKQPQSSEESSKQAAPVVWDSFHGTDDVARLATAARLQTSSHRESFHQSRLARNNLVQEDASSVTSHSGIEESVGVSDDENSPASRSALQSEETKKDDGTVSLTKDDFLHMKVIGQFNLGFILARCRNNHLWILDQHACDEKANFERLCATTVVHEQKLIAPLPLELSPSEENCVVENMDTFERNGFRFSYDPKKAPRHRLALTALPHSGSGGDGRKAVQFGKEDVGALCAMLGADGASSAAGYGAGCGTGADGSGSFGNNAVRRYAGGVGPRGDREKTSNDSSAKKQHGIVGSSIVRLPKAIAMFASRACRGSIMIGTALSQKEMVNVVRKLHDVDQPWNCPHGRPTMRHVKGLLDCLAEDERVAAETMPLAVFSQEFAEGEGGESNPEEQS